MPRLIALLALSLLAACMLVNDFGEYWNKAKPDLCLSKIGESLYYTEFRRDPEGKEMGDYVRGLKRDNANYLLLKQNADDAGGRMYRFTVRNGIFQRWRIDPAMRSTFERDYPDAPVSLKRDTITFETLGDAEWKLIDEIAGKDEYWEIEDQTLYNTLANPTCTFDDRDLSQYDQFGAPKDQGAPKPTK